FVLARMRKYRQLLRFYLQVVAIMRCFRTIQFHGCRAGEKGRALAIIGQFCPGRRVRHADKHADGAPVKVDPTARALAALDDDADLVTREWWYAAQLTASKCWT